MTAEKNNTDGESEKAELSRLCSILDLVERPTYCLDADGRILAANLSAGDVVGRPREKLVNRHARNVDPRIADWPDIFAQLQASEFLHFEPNLEGSDPRLSTRALQVRLWRPARRELAVVTLQDVRAEQVRDRAMTSRDAILQVISTAAARYLADESWDDSCNQLLKDLGEATGVSRVYIFEGNYVDDESLRFSQIFEWAGAGIEPQIDNPELQDIPLGESGYGRWLNLLSRGQLVAGNVSDFPASERDLLTSQSIKAIVVVPIFTGSKWWGLMGFDECTGPREWGVAETEALRTVASLFGLAVERREAGLAARKKRDNIAHEARLIAMGEMASSVAHEINQPLTAVNNYCETGLAAFAQVERDDEILERALRGAAAQAQRAGEIIRRLREFVRKGDTTRTLVDLNQLIEETISLIDHDARARKISIVKDCDSTLPAINVCRIQIQQVLFNLLRNGIEAIDENEDKPDNRERQISVHATQPHEHLVSIFVTDTGPGLRPQQADWIFEPFETSKPDGMGLGLSISRSILEAHGGDLRVDPGHTNGARFQVSLPCNNGEASG